MPKAYDILVAGEINPDLILTSPHLEPRFGQQEAMVDSADLTIGASSSIFACGAARLGLKVAIIGVVGEDLFGRFMLEELANRGVDVSHAIVDPRQQTGLSVILNRQGDRAILTHAGAIVALRADQVTDDLLRLARHLHIGSYYLQPALQPGLPDLFERAQRLGLSTSLDTNWDPTERWSGMAEALPLTDVFLPNLAEARSISKTQSVKESLAALGQEQRTVAIKLGAQGAAARQGEKIAQSPALPLQVVDTTGAGDTFDAGFLYGYLHGWELERSLQLGVACGSLSTRAAGGVVAQPTLDEALTAIAEHRNG
jgi:sugar/nucleoside kinase (ribokinase family)